MTMKIIEYVTGVLGIAISIIIYQQKERKNLLICKMISDIIWGVQFYSTGKDTAAVMSAVAIFRELIYIIYARKNKKVGVGWLIVFMTLAVSSSFVSLDGGVSFLIPAPLSILAGTCSALSAFSFWLGVPRYSRRIVFPYSSSMIIYDIFGGHGQICWFGLLNESFSIISSVVGIIRIDIKKRKSA